MDHITWCEGAEVMLGKEKINLSETTQHTEFMRQDAPTRINPIQQPVYTGGRIRLCSESEVCSQVGRRDSTEFQEDGMAQDEGDGAKFRGRSQSAPAALWAAKKYGRQLRRMSDEFDTWLDRGEPKRGTSSPGGAKQKPASRGWFSFLWRQNEAEGRE